MMAKNTNSNPEETVNQLQADDAKTTSPQESARLVTIKNLDAGTRDYPLADGSSLYLPMKHKGAVWPKIAESQVSRALITAERKGHIRILRKEA